MPDDRKVAPEEARPATITIPMRHAVRTVIDGASITVVPDGDPAPVPLAPAATPADADKPTNNPEPADKE